MRSEPADHHLASGRSFGKAVFGARGAPWGPFSRTHNRPRGYQTRTSPRSTIALHETAANGHHPGSRIERITQTIVPARKATVNSYRAPPRLRSRGSRVLVGSMLLLSFVLIAACTTVSPRTAAPATAPAL